MRNGTRRNHRWMAATLVLVLAACGSRTSNSTATTPAPPGATTVAPATTTTAAPAATAPATTALPTTTVDPTAQITANWERFFRPGTSVDDRIALLQNGEALRTAVEQNAGNPLQQQVSAKVTNVTLDSPTQATVTYDVSLNGTVALPAAQGMAVLENGTWKVAQASFCSLISLAATGPIPGCS